MPNTPSAIKSLKQSIKRRMHNRITKKIIRTFTKRTLAAVTAKEFDKAERGRVALADAGLLEARALAEADHAEIADALKSGGIKVPARWIAPIVRLARWLVERHSAPADAEGLDAVATESLRAELASLN